ncbi:MAG: hypothetical protein ACE5JG_06390 [Planctomycetota bacterium]
MVSGSRHRPPLFFIGLFFGLLAGVFLALALTTEGDTETFEQFTRRRQREQGGQRPIRGGATPGHGDPPARPGGSPHGGGAGDRARASQAKAHFMQKFVAALVRVPQNSNPNPKWESPLQDVEQPIRCADCHDPRSLNIEAMKRNALSAEEAEPFRRDRRFMVSLMRKWVGRLNAWHGDRLKDVVTCKTCHADDPSVRGGESRQQRAMAYAYFMTTFLRALRERPTTNREPARDWSPLLRDPAGRQPRCSTCHTEPAVRGMDHLVDADPLPRPARYAADHEFMVDLMQKWVSKLNRRARRHLRKAVTCTDCHETDPRR